MPLQGSYNRFKQQQQASPAAANVTTRRQFQSPNNISNEGEGTVVSAEDLRHAQEYIKEMEAELAALHQRERERKAAQATGSTQYYPATPQAQRETEQEHEHFETTFQFEGVPQAELSSNESSTTANTEKQNITALSSMIAKSIFDAQQLAKKAESLDSDDGSFALAPALAYADDKPLTFKGKNGANNLKIHAAAIAALLPKCIRPRSPRRSTCIH